MTSDDGDENMTLLQKSAKFRTLQINLLQGNLSVIMLGTQGI